MIKNKKINNWFFLIINDIILAMCIYFFTLGIRLSTGGIDGFSVLTLQLFQLFNIQIDNYTKEIIIIFLMIFYNLLSLIIGYKFFGKDFFIKTVILFLILHITIFFLFFIFGPAENNVLLKIIFKNNYLAKMIFASLVNGFFIGLTLNNIIHMGYTTGGMDILQKILKDFYKINFIIIVFITDGLIIIFSSLFESIITNYQNNNFNYSIFLTDLITRLTCSFLSIFIIGYIIENNIFKLKK
ncbi:YitT family protein [Candidatus Phytoplasma sacchari]|uniref:YitT family protein n=1 Tax=Candidatus Phytoplasma sacchari TaxID=2609813 RepID=A0ABY7M1J9_9MOLU|nr:YitT family protein [Candidatus Phytoplasma sacchari]